MPRDSDSLILQLYARTPAPCRDYCGLTVKRDAVVLNIWNVTYGPHVYPKRQTRSLEDFQKDKLFQAEVHRLFGEHVLQYVTSIAKNEKNLRNLPEKVFLNILKYLATKDILSMSQTSKIMFELCNTDNSWKILFRTYFKKCPTAEDAIVAESRGWKNTLLQKNVIKERKLSRNSKVSAKTPKRNVKQASVKNNINISNDNKKLQKSVVNNKNSNVEKALSNKIGNLITLLDQKKELLPSRIPNTTNINPRDVEKNTNTILPKSTNAIIGKNSIVNISKTSNLTVAKNINTIVPKLSNTINEKNIETIARKSANTKNKIDGAKSSSVLISPKTPILNNAKTNQTKSFVNLNRPIKTVQKNSLKPNRIKSSNLDVKVDIPKMFEGTAGYPLKVKMRSASSKPQTDTGKNKISLIKK